MVFSGHGWIGTSELKRQHCGSWLYSLTYLGSIDFRLIQGDIGWTNGPSHVACHLSLG